MVALACNQEVGARSAIQGHPQADVEVNLEYVRFCLFVCMCVNPNV